MQPVLSDAERTRLDERPDPTFYARQRFVTHADEAFLARLTDCTKRCSPRTVASWTR